MDETTYQAYLAAIDAVEDAYLQGCDDPADPFAGLDVPFTGTDGR